MNEYISALLSLSGYIVLSFLVHEMGHIIVMLFFNIKLQCVLMPHCNIWIEKKFVRIVKTKNGSEISLIPFIKKNISISKFRRLYVVVLIMGPIFTLILDFIFGSLYIVTQKNTFLMMFILNLIIFANCFSDNCYHVGDIKARSNILKDKIFFDAYYVGWYLAEKSHPLQISLKILNEILADLKKNKCIDNNIMLNLLYNILYIVNSEEDIDKVYIKEVYKRLKENNFENEAQMIEKINEFNFLHCNCDKSKIVIFESLDKYNMFYQSEYDGCYGIPELNSKAYKLVEGKYECNRS